MAELYEHQVSGFAGIEQGSPCVPPANVPCLTNTRGPHGSDPRETSETYKSELFRLGRYRVVVCCEDLQWLYQRRRPTITAGGVAWNTLGYCTNKISLMRLHRTHNGAEAQVISDLPFYFKRGAQK